MLTARFSIKLNDSSLAEKLKQSIKGPYVFPKLVDNLKAYKEDYELVEDESDLIDYTIREIRRLDKRRYLNY